MYCSNCGVELEASMASCPLCGQPVNDNNKSANVAIPSSGGKPPFSFGQEKMSKPQKKFTWQIISIILLSGSVASFAVDFIINHDITWSEYTMAIGLAIFSYVSLFAFWEQRTIVEIIGGFIVSSFFLLLLDALTSGIDWSIRLAIPLLLAANLVVILLIIVIRRSKIKGINLLAYAFMAAALLCVFIEGILNYFETGAIDLRWSVIVAACVIPVVVVLFFVYYRLKKGRSLQKTFHV